MKINCSIIKMKRGFDIMKKLFIAMMCVMLMTGCSTTKNTEKEPASVPKKEETVKKEDEQKTDQSKKNDEDKKEVKKEEKKTETKTDKKKDDTKNKTTVSKKTETKKPVSKKKKTTTTKKKPTTKKKSTPKKKTTPKKKKTDSITVKVTDYACIQCGYHCTTEKEILKHLDESDNCSSYAEYGKKFAWPEEWN